MLRSLVDLFSVVTTLAQIIEYRDQTCRKRHKWRPLSALPRPTYGGGVVATEKHVAFGTCQTTRSHDSGDTQEEFVFRGTSAD